MDPTDPQSQPPQSLTLALTEALRAVKAGGSESGGRVSVKIPKLSGLASEVTRLWLTQTEETLAAKSVAESKQAASAIGSLTGGALAWRLGSKEAMPLEAQQGHQVSFIPWRAPRAHLERGSPVAQEQINLRRTLRGLKQSRGVDHHVAEPRTIYGLTEQMSNFDALMTFIDGLRVATQKSVLCRGPRGLDEAIQEALRCDSAYLSAPSAHSYLQQLHGQELAAPEAGQRPAHPQSRGHPQRQWPSSGPEPMGLSNVSAGPRASSWGRGRDQPPIEEQRRRAQQALDRLSGACLNCHKAGHRRGSPSCSLANRAVSAGIQNLEATVSPEGGPKS